MILLDECSFFSLNSFLVFVLGSCQVAVQVKLLDPSNMTPKKILSLMFCKALKLYKAVSETSYLWSCTRQSLLGN